MGNNKYKVLIIEDDRNIACFIQTILETNGYQVLTAERCRQGLLVYSSHMPDLVVLILTGPVAGWLERHLTRHEIHHIAKIARIRHDEDHLSLRCQMTCSTAHLAARECSDYLPAKNNGVHIFDSVRLQIRFFR